jgi:hypothetical protein
MASSRGDFRDNRVSFITFNYDRSVEQFFFAALKNSFGVEGAELETLFSHLRIVHVHGLLGKFGTGDGARRFSPDVNETTVKIAASGIKVIHEAKDEVLLEYKQAHQLLAQADVVYFLGFGYQEDNVRRLRAGTIKSYDRLAGTGFGLGPAERTKATQLVGGDIVIDKPNHDCIAFLRSHSLY